jgi:mannosyltransferase OCH1-like enzyme/glycosyltransferase involved in cell wall biosynthesis
MPAIPHTITQDEYSHCAFTGKVQRFSPMMRSRGFEVIHYGVEGSQSGADRDVQILTRQEWQMLRIESYKVKDPSLSLEQILERLEDPKQYIGELGNMTYPLYIEFNKRLRIALEKEYRSTSTDIVCLPFGPAHEPAISDKNYVVIESGIGYPNAYREFRIYESYSKLHYNMHRDGKQLQNYWFVCPNYYNLNEWPLSLSPKLDTIGYFGRLEHIKGIAIVIECARLFPHLRFIICGQGDPTPFLIEPNIFYKEPIHGAARGEYLGSLLLLLAPSKFLEPFCGVSAEAQLCGTPVIGHDSGAIVENVEPFKTGLHCHTLSDFKYGIQMALDGRFDRKYIRDRAIRLFDMYNVGKKYEHAFKSLLDIFNGTNGWYSPNSHIACVDPLAIKQKREFESWTVPEISKDVSYVDKIAFVPEDYKFTVTSDNTIPRLLHLIWVGSDKAPEFMRANVEGWARLMPNWNIRIWTNSDINNNEFPENAVELINKAVKGAQKADIMRYFIIEKYGGVYMDIDVVPNKSLEPLVNFKDTSLVICHDLPLTWEYISIGFFAAKPNHPVFKTASEMCYKTILNTEDIHLKTGPFLLGHAIAKAEILEKIYLLPVKAFYRNEDYSDRFGCHTYAKMW